MEINPLIILLLVLGCFIVMLVFLFIKSDWFFDYYALIKYSKTKRECTDIKDILNDKRD